MRRLRDGSGERERDRKDEQTGGMQGWELETIPGAEGLLQSE